MQHNRKTYLFAVVLLLLSSSGVINAQESFSFAFFADIHFDGSSERTENLLHAINISDSINCNFIITGGDNVDAEACFISPDSATGCYDNYNSIINLSKITVYPTIGNHDRYLNTDEADPNYNTGLFESNTGFNDFYSFNRNNWHFIVINNVCFKDNPSDYEVSNEQLNWLKDDLQQTGTTTPVILIVHVPMVSIKKSFICKNKPRKRVDRAYRELWDQLNGYNLKAVLHGHYHIWKTSHVEGVPFITGGAVNTSWWSSLFNTRAGMVLITCNEDSLSYKYVTLNEK